MPENKLIEYLIDWIEGHRIYKHLKPVGKDRLLNYYLELNKEMRE